GAKQWLASLDLGTGDFSVLGVVQAASVQASGNAIVGTDSTQIASGNSRLALGSFTAQEGGQLQLNAPTAAGGKAAYIDTYFPSNGTSSLMRFMSGSNIGSDKWLTS